MLSSENCRCTSWSGVVASTTLGTRSTTCSDDDAPRCRELGRGPLTPRSSGWARCAVSSAVSPSSAASRSSAAPAAPAAPGRAAVEASPVASLAAASVSSGAKQAPFQPATTATPPSAVAATGPMKLRRRAMSEGGGSSRLHIRRATSRSSAVRCTAPMSSGLACDSTKGNSSPPPPRCSRA
eukprot:scaffold18729_cov66-Phaeocystis_antarctica.AAC.7